ncbi:MAG: hypothetical protein ACUVTH_09775 [Thermogutta sp.]
MAATLALGCRTPQIVTQLERENYALESKIWELVSLLEKKQTELDACRSELNELRSRFGAAGKNASASPPRELYAPSWPEKTDRTLQPSPRVGSSPEPFPLPEINVTPPIRETSPERALPGAASKSAPTPPPDENEVNSPFLLAPTDGETQPTPDVLPEETMRGASPLDLGNKSAPLSVNQISTPLNAPLGQTPHPSGIPARLSIPQEFLSGRDYDGQPGDDGIALLVQPRDTEGRVILEPAAISVVVVDPAVRGPNARVARWDLQPEEVRSYAVRRGDVTGFLLELPWPNRSPDHEDLKVFLRYYKPNGDSLEAQGDVRVSLPRPGP